MRPWSYSRLGTWESCPAQYWHYYVDRTPCKPRESAGASRGTLLHEQAELYLNGDILIYPPEFQGVSAHCMGLKAKKAIPEQKLAVNENWEPVDYDSKDVYLRAIIDVIWKEGTIVGVEDWKSGRQYPEHPDQIATYVAIAAAHHPDATEYRGRLIYIDQGIVTPPKITAADRIKPIRMLMDGRIKNAEADAEWPTRSGSHCRWCDYSKANDGPCRY